MRILSFGYDTDLLSPGGENESQYRQRRYCEWLDQDRDFVVMARESPGSGPVVKGRLRVFDACSSSRAMALWRAARRGLMVARKDPPDAVEYQDPQLAGVAAWWVARRLGKPLLGGVFTDFLNNPAWYRAGVLPRLYNGAGRLVLGRTRLARCDSRETADSLRAQGFASVRYAPFFIPHLSDLDPGPEGTAARRKVWAEGPVVLCVARLSREKNVSLLLRAFARLPARARLVIVGRGPLGAELKALADVLGVAPRVEWAGFLPFEGLARKFRESHLFAFPSDFETSARVLVQAQAAGLPTVTTATSGSARLVRHGETGFVTPVGDEEAFSAALVRLTEDAGLYDRFLSADRRGVLAEYGDAGVRGALEAFYREALEEPKP